MENIQPTPSIEPRFRHDLAGPVSTVRLYSESLLEGGQGNLTPEQREYVEEIHRAAVTMASLLAATKRPEHTTNETTL